MALQDAEEMSHKVSSQYPSATSRPYSATHIPRPVSGTSRRASRTTIVQPNVDEPKSSSILGHLVSPHQTHHRTRLSQKLSRITNSMPPISYPLPKAMLPRTSHLPPCNSQPEEDFSSAQQSLHLENSIAQPLDVLANAAAPSAKKAWPNAVQEFNQFASSFSKRREVTPRTLLKPIQPSLIRSQTAGQIACFGTPHTISPSKPARKSSLGHAVNEDNGNQLEVINAGLESRTMEHEIDTLNHIRGEAMANQNRLLPRRRLISNNAESAVLTTKTPLNGRWKTPVSINLSVNDVVNADRLEKQRQGSITRRPLFVNTTLANEAKNYGSSPLSCTTHLSGKTCHTISPSGSSPDPRNVYSAQGIKFWVGRYSATTDHMRKRDCDFLLNPENNSQQPLNINSTEFEEKFDKLEETRSTRVLEELRQYCKTQSAAESFGRFEMQFKKKLSKSPPIFVRSYSEIFTKQTRDSQRKVSAQNEATGIRQYSGNNTTSQLSTFNAHATIEKLSGLVGKRGGLVKSRTTGNLALRSTAERNPTPGLPGILKKHKCCDTTSQTQQMSSGVHISETRARATQERETRPKVDRNALFRTPGLKALPSSGNGKKPNAADTQWPLRTSDRCTVTGTVTGSALIGPDLTASALESGHGLPPPRPQFLASGPGHDDRLMDNRAIKETIVYRKTGRDHRGSGPSSGEFVKKVVGVSMREVRKMGRRVGSLGWSNNSDEMQEDCKMLQSE